MYLYTDVEKTLLVATLYSEAEAISETHARLMLLLIRWIRAVEHVTRAHNIKVCYSVLQCVAVWCIVSLLIRLIRAVEHVTRAHNIKLQHQCVAVCCSVLQCAAVCCSVVQCGAVWCSVLLLIRWIRAVEHVTRAHNIKVCCSVLQCVAVCSSVLQCGAVWCSVVQGAAVCCSVL